MIFVSLIAIERVILGYHSILQVIVGASLGVLLHFYSTRTPQYFIIIDSVIQVEKVLFLI